MKLKKMLYLRVGVSEDKNKFKTDITFVGGVFITDTRALAASKITISAL